MPNGFPTGWRIPMGGLPDPQAIRQNPYYRSYQIQKIMGDLEQRQQMLAEYRRQQAEKEALEQELGQLPPEYQDIGRIAKISPFVAQQMAKVSEEERVKGMPEYQEELTRKRAQEERKAEEEKLGLEERKKRLEILGRPPEGKAKKPWYGTTEEFKLLIPEEQKEFRMPYPWERKGIEREEEKYQQQKTIQERAIKREQQTETVRNLQIEYEGIRNKALKEKQTPAQIKAEAETVLENLMSTKTMSVLPPILQQMIKDIRATHPDPVKAYQTIIDRIGSYITKTEKPEEERDW